MGSEFGASRVDADHDVTAVSLSALPRLENERPFEARMRPAA
jgi:hypothetical protein